MQSPITQVLYFNSYTIISNKIEINIKFINYLEGDVFLSSYKKAQG